MLIGQVLARPQRLQRTTAIAAELALARDALDFGLQIAAEPQRAQALLPSFEAGIAATTDRMRAQAQSGLGRAQQKLRNWVQPAIDLGREVTQAVQGVGDADGLEKAAEVFLQRLAGLAKELTLDELRKHAALLVDVIENDLGLSGAFLEQQVWALAEDLIARLEDVPASADAQARDDRLAAAALVRRARRLLRGQFKLPALNAEQIARMLLRLIQESGAKPVIDKAACAAGRMSDVMEVGNALSALMPKVDGKTPAVPPFPLALIASAALGVGGEPARDGPNRYAWYATWLLQYKHYVLLGLSDLKDAKGLARDLKSGTGPVLQVLRDRLSQPTRDMLETLGDEEPSDALKFAMIDDLNRVIRDPGAFDSSPPGTPEEGWLHNRTRIEDALPQRINALSRGAAKFFGGVWDWIKENVGAWPGAPVRTDASGTRLLHDDTPLHTAANLAWHQAPLFDPRGDEPGYYTFEHIKPPAMENTAWISAISSDATRLGWRIYQIVDMHGHRVPSFLLMLYTLTHGLITAFARKPLSGFGLGTWGKLLDWEPGLPFQFGLPMLLTTLGSIQGRHTEASFKNQLAFWFTTWMGDVVNLLGPPAATTALRDAVLSFLTLYNFGGPRDGPSTLPDNPAENHNVIDGIVGLSTTGFGYLLVSLIDRKDYAHPGEAPGKVWAIGMGGGAGMGLLAGFVGTLAAQIIAWGEDWRQLGLTMLKSMPKMMVMFWPLLYSWGEGDTNDGKFNATGADFAGYPGPAAQSPYKLPYASGKTIAVGQANQGMWSHHFPGNAGTVQVYAFDFALDQAEEILAARPGTVVAFTENVPDDTSGQGWNFIAIAHNVDDAGNSILDGNLRPIAPFDGYDRDVGGTPRMTFGIYGHGRTNGVTAAFARHTPPVPTANIIGTRVRQGMPIMLAGDTGTSFHNHLHMHVVPEVLPRPGGNAGPVVGANRGSYTVPFVFSDVDGNGVCKARHWYTATQARRTS